MTKEFITVSAPGRICLFGEHQDYFGLPVIAAAIDLRLTISGTPRSDEHLEIDLPDIGEKETISLQSRLSYTKKRDYLKSAVNVLQRLRIAPSHGWDCRVQGDIPINAGAASSSALVVAWIKFLLEASDAGMSCGGTEIAEWSYLAEVEEFSEPGGKMDHYTSSLGGINLIEFGEEQAVTAFENTLGKFVLADSLERKKTTATLGFIKKHVQDSLTQIQKRLPDFDLNSPLGKKEYGAMEKLPPPGRQLLQGTFITRDITGEGQELFRQKRLDHDQFGRLLTRQQEILREYLGVSTPKIDKMITAALDAGALGAKINGSGEGGSIFAYTPRNSENVAAALQELETKVHIINVDEGVRREKRR